VPSSAHRQARHPCSAAVLLLLHWGLFHVYVQSVVTRPSLRRAVVGCARACAAARHPPHPTLSSRPHRPDSAPARRAGRPLRSRGHPHMGTAWRVGKPEPEAEQAASSCRSACESRAWTMIDQATPNESPISRDEMFAAARALIERGYQVILLYGTTTDGICECSWGPQRKSPGKHPRERRWVQRPIRTV